MRPNPHKTRRRIAALLVVIAVVFAIAAIWIDTQPAEGNLGGTSFVFFVLAAALAIPWSRL